MTHVRVLDDHYEVPDDFDPHAYLSSAWGIVAGPPLKVRLRFRNDVAHRVHAHHHRNLRIDHTTDDGDLLVTATYGQDKHGITIDLLPWLYAFGAGVTRSPRERIMKKLGTFEGVHRALTASPHTPRILPGDLDTPHTERPDGTVRYWQHSCATTLRPELEARWLAAERGVIEGLRDHDLTDVYRLVHGPNGDAFSWEHGASRNRYRYDHVLASREFTATSCDYLHEFRLNGDPYTTILAELAWTKGGNHDQPNDRRRRHRPLLRRAAPFLFVFIVIALVVPYSWLLLIAFAVWYLIIRYVPAEAIGRATSQHESES